MSVWSVLRPEELLARIPLSFNFLFNRHKPLAIFLNLTFFFLHSLNCEGRHLHYTAKRVSFIQITKTIWACTELITEFLRCEKRLCVKLRGGLLTYGSQEVMAGESRHS